MAWGWRLCTAQRMTRLEALPMHSMAASGASGLLIGAARLPHHSHRHTLLKARGWRVVSVPFYHWSGESGAMCLPACLLLRHAAAPLRLAACAISCTHRFMAGVHLTPRLHPTPRPAIPRPALQRTTGRRCCGA